MKYTHQHLCPQCTHQNVHQHNQCARCTPLQGCQHPPGKQRSPPAGRVCLQSCSGTPPPNRLREPDTGLPLRDFLSATPVKLLSRCHFFSKHLYIAQNASLPSCLCLKLWNYCWGWEEGTQNIGLMWEAAAAATSSAGVCVCVCVCVGVCVGVCAYIGLKLFCGWVCVCMRACVRACIGVKLFCGQVWNVWVLLYTYLSFFADVIILLLIIMNSTVSSYFLTGHWATQAKSETLDLEYKMLHCLSRHSSNLGVHNATG